MLCWTELLVIFGAISGLRWQHLPSVPCSNYCMDFQTEETRIRLWREWLQSLWPTTEHQSVRMVHKNRLLPINLYLVSENMVFQNEPSSWSAVVFSLCHRFLRWNLWGLKSQILSETFTTVLKILVTLSCYFVILFRGGLSIVDSLARYESFAEGKQGVSHDRDKKRHHS